MMEPFSIGLSRVRLVHFLATFHQSSKVLSVKKSRKEWNVPFL